MTINNNPTPNLELFFSLTPPGAEGDPFSKLATDVNGVPIGDKTSSQVLVNFLGYSDKDTIGSALDEILELASQLNVSLVASTSNDAVQNHVNNIDPSQPNIPPIRAFLMIAEKDLQAGKIGGFNFSIAPVFSENSSSPDASLAIEATTNKQTKTAALETEASTVAASSEDELSNKEKVAQTSTNIQNNLNIASQNLNSANNVISFAKSSGGNKWLGGNVYVAFLTEFMDLQRMLMRNKEVQGQVEIQGMNLVVELAKTTADMIMDVAKTQQMIHIVSAVMAAVSMAVSVVAMSAGLKSGSMEQASMISTMGSQVEKLSTSTIQAATDITIAEKEGRKEVLQAYRTIAQRQMDKSGEAFKASEDAIMQLLQTLDKIRDGLQQAVAAALRR